MSEIEFAVSNDPALELGAALGAWGQAGKTIVLTGGSTIGRAYERATEVASDWSASAVWWTDERCVPPDDERSNYGLAKHTLLDRLAETPKVHRMRGELPPSEAAAEYERELAGVEFGVLLLGLGSDGHIASLFPGSPQLAERKRLVTSGPPGLEPWVDRVTLTLPALLSAPTVAFLVTGKAKADAVALAFRGPITEDVPASLLRTGDASILVFLDPAAAAG